MAMFAEVLRTTREAAGLSQAELSRLSGVPQPSISAYEAGETDPSWSAVQRLADALGVSTEALRETPPRAMGKRK